MDSMRKTSKEKRILSQVICAPMRRRREIIRTRIGTTARHVGLMGALAAVLNVWCIVTKAMMLPSHVDLTSSVTVLTTVLVFTSRAVLHLVLCQVMDSLRFQSGIK